jgi:glycosyltransferase involved in cell wall biosynthesis
MTEINQMKILWVNPTFLDYRIPVYKKMNELTNGNFYLIYSKKRTPVRVINKIINAIGDHAICLSNEIVLKFPGTGDFSNTDLKLPLQPGLYKAISKIDADIVIGEGFFQWTPEALLKTRLNRKKFLISYERTAHTERNCPKWRSAYRKFISNFVDGYLVNGRLTKEYLIQLGINDEIILKGGLSADSDNLITSVSSFSIEERNRLKIKLTLNEGLTYLYVGQFNERKGLIQLLKAWKKHIEKHPYDNLVTIGSGPLFDQITKESLNFDSIKLLGHIDYDSIYKYYSIAEIFIIATLEDNWSLVVPEAIACGLPIACSIYNGCYPELVHDGINGKLFDPLKEETIIETLDYFHHADLELMGRQSLNIEKNYNADSVAQNIYNSCITIKNN